MTDLIAALEAAGIGSRTLDARIDCLVRFPEFRPSRHEDHAENGTMSAPGYITTPTGFLISRCYTFHIDDALTLVPRDHNTALYISEKPHADVWPFIRAGLFSGMAPTPAFALCIAALRARAALGGGDHG